MRGGSVPSRNVYESSNNPVGYIGITHSFGQGSAFLKDDPCIFALPVWGGRGGYEPVSSNGNLPCTGNGKIGLEKSALECPSDRVEGFKSYLGNSQIQGPSYR